MKRKHVATVVIIGLLLFVVLMNRAVAWGAYYSHQTERETRFAPFLGCMVKTKTGWVPRNELRVVQ